MPFAVRQWPVQPDPRGSLYSFVGWDWGQVVSFRWIMSSTNATGDYSFLNDGIVLSSFSDDGSLTSWRSTDTPFPVTEVRVGKIGLDPPAGVPPVSIAWSFDILSPSIPRFVNGEQQYLFPKAIRTFGPWAAIDTSGPVLEIPDGVTITPARWDFELP